MIANCLNLNETHKHFEALLQPVGNIAFDDYFYSKDFTVKDGILDFWAHCV